MADEAVPSNISKEQAVRGWLEERRKSMALRGRRAMERAKEAGVAQRAQDVAVHGTLIIAGATVPAWILTRNPDWQYVDEEKTVETEALLAFGTLGIAALAHIAVGGRSDIPEYGMSIGFGMTASYLGKRAREMAEQANAEDS